MNTAVDTRSLTHTELEEALASVRIPAYPATVAEVMREAQKDEPQVKVLARIISSDVGMSALAVKLANSPMFGNGNPVKSVQQAVSRLGTRNILNVVIAVALRNTTTGLPTDLMERFWARTSTLALATGVLARRHIGISPDAAYTYALFHDAAIPVLMLNFPNYAEICGEAIHAPESLIPIEREHFNCDHAVVGWLLARSWGLPPLIASAIRYHHDPEVYILPEKELPSDALALIAVTVITEHAIADLTGTAAPVDNKAFEDAKMFLGSSDADIDEFREIIAAVLA